MHVAWGTPREAGQPAAGKRTAARRGAGAPAPPACLHRLAIFEGVGDLPQARRSLGGVVAAMVHDDAHQAGEVVVQGRAAEGLVCACRGAALQVTPAEGGRGGGGGGEVPRFSTFNIVVGVVSVCRCLVKQRPRLYVMLPCDLCVSRYAAVVCVCVVMATVTVAGDVVVVSISMCSFLSMVLVIVVIGVVVSPANGNTMIVSTSISIMRIKIRCGNSISMITISLHSVLGIVCVFLSCGALQA